MITPASRPTMNVRSENREIELLHEIRKKQRHLKFLYNHGTDQDLSDYRKTEKELIDLVKNYEETRGVKHFTVRKGTKVLYKR